MYVYRLINKITGEDFRRGKNISENLYSFEPTYTNFKTQMKNRGEDYNDYEIKKYKLQLVLSKELLNG